MSIAKFDRAQRRAETLRICSNRHRQWSSPPMSPGTVQPIGRYAKQSGGCGCTKHRKNNPRVAGGLCDMGQRDRIYRWRRLTKQISLVIRQGADPHGDFVACLDEKKLS